MPEDFDAPTGHPPRHLDLSSEVAAIRAQLAADAQSSAVWRWLGGIAAALAISLGGWALSLASQAAVDHARVDRLEQTERAISERMERLIEAQTRTQAQLEQMTSTLAELRADVRELRDEHAQETRR